MKFSSALVLSSLVSATLARGFASHEKSNLLARQNRQGGGGGGGFRPPPQNGRPPQNGGGNGRPPQNGGGKPPAQPPKPSAKPPATQPGKPATPPPATGGGGGGGGINAGELCLKPENIQLGSNNDGTSNKSVKFSVAAIKSASNHINHCSDVRPDLRKTNGTQSNEASCNGIPLGFVPSVNNIPSATVVFPKNLEQVPANTDFTFKVKIANFQAGSFTSAAETYYASPCQGNKDGNAIGHTHVVAKKMSSYQDISIRDVTKFDFFLGVDTGPGADGNLEAPVKGGLAVGFYRVSTITSCETHQMINGPRAQRDTIEGSSIFEVVAAGGGGGAAPGNGNATPAPAPAPGNGNANPAPGTGGGNAGGQPPKQCKRRRKAKRLAQRALEMEVAAL